MCAYTKDDRLWLGLVAFVVGAVVLLQRFDVVPAETWDYLWPSILVVSGLKWMMTGCASASSSCESACESMCGDCGSVDCQCEVLSAPVKKASSKKAPKKK